MCYLLMITTLLGKLWCVSIYRYSNTVIFCARFENRILTDFNRSNFCISELCEACIVVCHNNRVRIIHICIIIESLHGCLGICRSKVSKVS